MRERSLWAVAVFWSAVGLCIEISVAWAILAVMR